MNEIKYHKIGIIHSPFKEPKGTPIQASAAKGIDGTVEVFQEYAEGLKDLQDFSHIILFYHFHLIKESSLIVEPFLDNSPHGIFATRAPNRPNPIGISIVRLTKLEGNLLYVKGLDIVDGTPLLDIKPYVAAFDIRDIEKEGWLEQNVHKLAISKDDGRFTKNKNEQAKKY